MRMAVLSVLALAVTAAACRSVPPDDSPAADASAMAREISAIRSAPPADEPVVPESMDLEEIVELALRRNETVLHSNLGVAVANAGVNETFGAMFGLFLSGLAIVGLAVWFSRQKEAL